MLPNLMLARGCVNPRPAANHAVTGIERSLVAIYAHAKNVAASLRHVQCARLHWQMSSG